MPSLMGNAQVQGHVNQYIELPEEVIRHMPDAVNKQKHIDEAPSLLSTAGWGAAATGIFQAKPMWSAREISKNSLSTAGRVAKNLGAGSIAGAAVTAPADYLSGRMAYKYKYDKEFNAGHFASIAAPAAVAGTIGTGSFLNTVNQMENVKTLGTKNMMKNIVSPQKILGATKQEFSNLGASIKSGNVKKMGMGLLGVGLMAASAIDPLMYIAKTRKKKGDDIQKTASIKKKIQAARLKNRLVGSAVIAAGTYTALVAAKDKAKKDLRELKDSPHAGRNRLGMELGLYQ
jgi:hypothetical protein